MVELVAKDSLVTETESNNRSKYIFVTQLSSSNAERLFEVFSSYFRTVITAFGGGYYGRHLLDEGVINFVIPNLEVSQPLSPTKVQEI